MIKHILPVLLILFLVPSALAIPNLEIQKIDRGSVIVSELNNPAIFEFVINNKGPLEQFQIYSLISVSFWPIGKFELTPGKNNIEIRVFPKENLRENLGLFQFEYQIKGESSGIFKDKLILKILKLEEVLELETEPIKPGDDSATITIINKENTLIEDTPVLFESQFFSSDSEFSIEPFGETTITVPLNKNEKKNFRRILHPNRNNW